MKHFSKQKLLSYNRIEHTYFAIDEKDTLDIISNLLSEKKYTITEKAENKVSLQKGNKFVGRLLGVAAHYHAIEILVKAEMNGFLTLWLNHKNRPLFNTKFSRQRVEEEIKSVSKILQNF